MKIIHANVNILSLYGLPHLLSPLEPALDIKNIRSLDDLRKALKENPAEILIIERDQKHGFTLDNILNFRKDYPKLKILIISTRFEKQELKHLNKAGIQAYLTKYCEADEYVKAIEALKNDEKFFCNAVLNILLDKESASDNSCDPTILTHRETEIIKLIASGKTNREAAEKLFLSPHTVHTHRKNIMKKLKVNSTTGLVLYAINAGLIAPDSV